MKATNGEQQPYLYGSLSKDSIYLRPPSSDQMLAALPPIAPPTRPANPLFTAKDEALIASVAASKKFNLPAFQINAIEPDVSANFRRFVGIWVSKVGNGGNGRQIMVIVTHVDQTGLVSGFYAWGPPNEATWNQNPASFVSFRSPVRGDGFQFLSANGKQTNRLKLLGDGRLTYQAENNNGRATSNMTYPLWTLSAREQGREPVDVQALTNTNLKGKNRP